MTDLTLRAGVIKHVHEIVYSGRPGLLATQNGLIVATSGSSSSSNSSSSSASGDLDGVSVRVMGKLIEFDATTARARIRDVSVAGRQLEHQLRLQRQQQQQQASASSSSSSSSAMLQPPAVGPADLSVDTRLLDSLAVHFKPGSVFQFIGELRPDNEGHANNGHANGKPDAGGARAMDVDNDDDDNVEAGGAAVAVKREAGDTATAGPEKENQVGGAVPGPPRRWLLRARVVRCVDGMDTTLYEQALAIRRKFEGDTMR